jgi:hypothetical protein
VTPCAICLACEYGSEDGLRRLVRDAHAQADRALAAQLRAEVALAEERERTRELTETIRRLNRKIMERRAS